jgi:hypothetical protein
VTHGHRGHRHRIGTAWRRALGVAAAVAALTLSGSPAGVLALPGQPTPTDPPTTTAPPRVRLVSQTPWVTPGGDLRLVISTTDVPDPAAVDVAVSLYPRITNRADLSASFTGDGLKSALWQRPGGPVHLADLPTGTDGSRTITIPTQDPAGSLDRARARVQAGIYPVEIQLLSASSGDTLDRLVTHLLTPETPKDGTKLGVVAILPISARPAVSAEGVRTGPPEGAATIAAVAAGLATAPSVQITTVANPETLEALNATSPTTAQALAAALGDRPVVARPYVPLRVPALGDQAGPILTAELDAGTAALAAALGRPPTSTAWVADEPLDTAALGELASVGTSQLIVSANDLAPPATSRTAAPAGVPRQPVPVNAGGGRSVRALVADPSLATHTDPATVAADQPLAAHQLLTELAGIVLLPQARGGTAPSLAALGSGAATVLPPRSWRPTQAFLSEFLTGLLQSPILTGVDPAAAFALSTTGPVVSTSLPASRRSTTTTTAFNGRTLAKQSAPDTRLGRTMTATSASLAAHTSVLPDTQKADVPASQQALVAASADLPAEEQMRRLTALGAAFEGDLRKIKVPPSGRPLVLASRSGQLPIGFVNDAPSQARVLLRVSSEKLEFPDGTDRIITLAPHRPTPERLRVRAKTGGVFPMRVTLLTPDGTRQLDETEYRVRSNSLPGVGIAVSIAAGLVLAFWWGKTLLFNPRGAHLRSR